MCGGGGSTTNVTNTGLGDQQYENIMDSGERIYDEVEGINPKIDNVYNQNVTTQGLIRETRTDLAGRMADANAKLDNVGSGLAESLVDPSTGRITNVATEFGNLSDSMNDSFGTVNTGIAGVNTNVSDARKELGDLSTGLGTLTSTVNTGLTNTNQNITDLGTDMRTGFSDTQTAINTGVGDLTTQIDDRFDTQNENLATNFQGTNERLDTVQTNVLGGQDRIRGLVEEQGVNLNRYYGDLAEGQSLMQDSLGGIQTGLGSFRDTYDRNESLATQQRSRLSDSVTGGFNTVREDIGTTANTLGENQARVASQVTGLGAQVGDIQQNTDKNFSMIARDIATGFSDGSVQSQNDRNDFISRLSAIRALLGDSNINVDQTIRQQFSDLANSFDEQGRLIARSVDQQGNQLSRAIDTQGNLLMAQFTPNGDRAAQQVLDINRMMQALDQVGYRATNVSSGTAQPYYTSGQ